MFLLQKRILKDDLSCKVWGLLYSYVYGIEDFDKSISSRNLLESVLIVHRKLHIFIKNNEVLSLNTRLAQSYMLQK